MLKSHRLMSALVSHRHLLSLSAPLLFIASVVGLFTPLHASHQQKTTSSTTTSSSSTTSASATSKPGVSALSSSSGLGASVSSFNIQSFNADLFTGSAGAEIPIVVPPGAAGVMPRIVLRYNSGVVDDLSIDGDPDQADWSGLGWSLDTGGFVIRDTKGTTTTSDDTFKLVFGGDTHDLISIGSGNYRTKDETFLAITYVSASDYWTVKTKDGTTHRFGYNTDSKGTGLTFATNVEVPVTFRYFLDEVSTTSGVSVRYSYYKQSSSYNGKAYDQAVYPDTITYAYRNNSLIGAVREVKFIRGNRSDWTDVSGSQHTSYHELYQLDAIEVKVGASLVRRYNFTHDYSIDRNPSQNWGGGAAGDLTLKTITMLGTDAVSSLPPFTFTYSDALLASANNGIGGQISFSYERVVPIYSVSDWYKAYGLDDWWWECGTTPNLRTNSNSGCDSAFVAYMYAGKLDGPRHRVTSRTQSDGRGWSSTTSFNYWNPDISADAKEFRGHAQVRATDPLGNYTDTWFYQDDVMKGRAYQTETRSNSGALFNKMVNTFTTTSQYAGVTFVRLDRSDYFECEGQSSCHQNAETFTYDSDGNPTQKNDLGDVPTGGDERTEVTDWVVDTNNWIHRSTRTALLDNAGATVRERWMYYDNAAYGVLGTRGLVTKEEFRLAGSVGNSGNPTVTSGYDVYGNRTSSTDARSCTTTTVFESSQTYPSTVTNCLTHSSSMVYDDRFGVVTSQTDANNQTTTSTYDVFGRPTKVTGPLDGSSTYGTVSRFYDNWGDPNLQKVRTHRTEQHGTANVLWSEEYFDGLGRSYKSQQEGPSGQTIVGETTFDVRGLQWKTSAPRFTTETAVWTEFLYDVLARQTRVNFPDGTNVQTAYDHHEVIATDPRGNVKRTYTDSHHRVNQVEEVNGGSSYFTTYQYDAADSLIKVTNAAGHNALNVYDLLGRKIAMCDPNMGTASSLTVCTTATAGAWVYTYNLAGDLLTQKDAKNQTLTFTYDSLGRTLTKKQGTTSLVTWTYDDATVLYSKGRVTQIVDQATTTKFTYDQMGRTTQTQRLLLGVWKTMSQSYDALSRITSETFPDNEVVTYNYNSAGWLNSVPGYINAISYNARGQKTQLQYANGVTTDWTFNANNFRVNQRATYLGALPPLRVALSGWVKSWTTNDPAPPSTGFANLYRGGICTANASGACIGGDATANSGIGPVIGYLKTSGGAGTVPAYQSTCYSSGGTCTGRGLSLTVNGSPVGYLSTTAPDGGSSANPFIQSNGLLLQGLTGTASAYLWSYQTQQVSHTDHFYASTGSPPSGILLKALPDISKSAAPPAQRRSIVT